MFLQNLAVKWKFQQKMVWPIVALLEKGTSSSIQAEYWFFILFRRLDVSPLPNIPILGVDIVKHVTKVNILIYGAT